MAAPTIPHMEDRNLVGICHLDVVEVDDVISVGDEHDGNVLEAVVLREGATWSRVYLDDDGGSLVELWKKEKGVQHADARISGKVAKDRLVLMPGLWRMKGRRYLVLATTRNHDVLLMGRKETPAVAQVHRRQTGDGAQMESDRNEYDISFELQRRWPVPFYLAEPPPPPSAGATLADLLPAASAATIAALLSPEQTTALQALLCEECPTLCQLLDEALDAEEPVPGMTVSGAGHAPANGDWDLDGEQNGRNRYVLATLECYWNGSTWFITDSIDGYYSADDVAEPWLVTTWQTDLGWDAPAPSVTQRMGNGAATVVACLTTEQRAMLLAALE